tara:strand:+ start:592 stop:936 length:345 start_codon:yes stop_codon:yes gene_type:complete
MLTFLHELSSKKWHQNIYKYFLYISYVLFLFSLLGIGLFKTDYLDILNGIIKIYIALVLIIRFNPFIKPHYEKNNIHFDREISFSAGVLLLLSTFASKYLNKLWELLDIPDMSV